MSKQIYDELIAAGAPKLPDKYFYRIERDSYLQYVYSVDLRERGRVFSCSVVRDVLTIDMQRYTKNNQYTFTEIFVQMCQELYGTWRHASYEADRLESLKRFLGDHP